MNEIWKDVIVDKEEKDEYKGRYQVSNLGRVKNAKTGLILKIKIQKDGYARINFCNKTIIKSYSVHRLVLLAFNYEGFFDKAQGNHKDENKLNNNLNNLEWCTPKYNSNYGTRNQKISNYQTGRVNNSNGRGNNSNVKNRSKKVAQVDMVTGKTIKKFETISQITKEYGYHEGNISECCNNKRNKANGYYWKLI